MGVQDQTQCKWIYEHVKCTKLVAKSYGQTYGIDYEETQFNCQNGNNDNNLHYGYNKRTFFISNECKEHNSTWRFVKIGVQKKS